MNFIDDHKIHDDLIQVFKVLMKTLIAGSRTTADLDAVAKAIESAPF